MVTKKYLVFLLIPFLCCCRTNNISGAVCGTVHNGQLISNLYNATGFGHWTHAIYYIERSENKQIETLKYPMNIVKVYKIQWLTDCEYVKTIFELNDWSDSAIAKMYPHGQKFKILKVTSDYIIEKSFKGNIDTLWFQK
jgi:hypothetical protein